MAHPRILIVDDEPSIRQFLAKVFVEAGYEVVEAGNGNEAILAANRGAVDVLITDLVMPDKDGLELIRYFRKNLRNVIVIAMSGADLKDTYLNSGRLLGAHEIIEKPLKSADIVQRVADLLARKALARGDVKPER